MKKKLTVFLGLGDRGELWVCDRCGKQSNIANGVKRYGLFESLKSGDFCFECLKKVDTDATHLWIPLNGAKDHFGSFFIEESNFSPPTHLDYCSKCYTYRSIQKIGRELRASYYPIGSKSLTISAPICCGENRVDPGLCQHDYVKVLNNDRSPSHSEIKASKKMLKNIQGSIVGQAFGYTSIDMDRSVYGFSVYWCCKCGTARTITRGQRLPSLGTDPNFPSRYST